MEFLDTEAGETRTRPRTPSNPRGRGWCFTLNNPEDDFATKLENTYNEMKAKYLVFQLESGEREGTRHVQGYIYFESDKSFNQVKVQLGNRSHIEKAKGNPAQNRDYCTKEGTRLQGPWEFGECPMKGKRSDLEGLKKDLDDGQSLRQVSQNHFSNFLRYRTNIQQYQLLNKPKRNWPMEVLVLWGPTGTGKSRFCQDTYPDAYWKSKNSGTQQFWDGYLGEDVIIVDEFYGWLSWDYLLRLTDRYPFSLDTKHGTVQCSARTIVFTSNKHPREWYPNSKYEWDDTNPLKRRLTSIREMERTPVATGGAESDAESLEQRPVSGTGQLRLDTAVSRPTFRNGLSDNIGE